MSIKQQKLDLMREYVQKLDSLKEIARTLVSQTIQIGSKDLAKIRSNRHLSREGIENEVKEARKHYKTAFAEESKELHDKKELYIKIAREIAYEILSSPVKNTMTESQTNTFNAKLQDLKIRVMLNPNKEAAAREVRDFVNTIDNEYQASLVMNQFDSLASAITANGGASEQSTLLKIYEQVKEKTLNDEKREAKEVLESVKDFNLFLTDPLSPINSQLVEVVGKLTVQRANEPDRELDRFAVGDYTDNYEAKNENFAGAGPAITSRTMQPTNE